MKFNYDIIVVGGGHAGCEAAAAAANMGASVLLITMDMGKMAAMSCNPAIGGIAKGQIVREIDALGGYTGIITDRSTIQFRMLNKSKGPAMWSPRAQCDKTLFSELWRQTLENIEGLHIWQDSVRELVCEDNKVKGVVTSLGAVFTSRCVVLTAGTFLNGLMHVGRRSTEGGRAGDQSSKGITEQLVSLGFEAGRMKTGTPVRIDGRSIDFGRLDRQDGDAEPDKFSYLTDIKYIDTRDQVPCYLAYTNRKVHDILRTGFEDSPLFTGTIQGIGPRYCPSIEDKLRTFSDKDSHQLFLEPEGRSTNEYYLNGFSSSLPLEVQVEALKNIEGFENIDIYRPGYAIEYDYFPPTQLKQTLETKLIDGLYFAGQINGTTGYEEAGAQGLMAGINAALKISGGDVFVLRRDEAYIGVLIDDLVTKGVDEPYRMFTSRAEYRILLRQDNADLRLTRKGIDIGLVDEKRKEIFENKLNQIELLNRFLKTTSVEPSVINPLLSIFNSSLIDQKRKLQDIVSRNNISLIDIINTVEELSSFISENQIKEEVIEQCEIQIKYKGYIERERHLAEKLLRLESIKIRPDFDFSSLQSLSTEARQKLTRIKPATIGQAARIPGVSPADLNVLLIFFGR